MPLKYTYITLLNCFRDLSSRNYFKFIPSTQERLPWLTKQFHSSYFKQQNAND